MTALTGVDEIIIHHSASSTRTTLDDIDQWHRDKGWEGIGYHYVIEYSGAIKLGRRFPAQGAHVRHRNANTIGVCLCGDNTVPAEHWSYEQRTALYRLVDALHVVFGVIPVRGHRDISATPTQCPGLDVAGLFT